jgi:hypothetical protein
MTFLAENSDVSPSGVRIARDFRENLIIDRFDPVFADMRASKIKHLRSANSEDAVTWNVFRSLRQIDPAAWLPTFWKRAFRVSEGPADQAATVHLWPSIDPPLGLLALGDEGASEVDILIESPTWVWFIEAKYRSDISTGTTTRPDRDQILRNIDVGSHYAGVRQFYFSLLTISPEQSPKGAERIERYADLEHVRSQLPHRPDRLMNVRGVGSVHWSDLAFVLKETAARAKRTDECEYASRAVAWLNQKGIVARDG